MSLLNLLSGGKDRKQQAIDEYNLGFHAKYSGDWAASLLHNRRAAELNPSDQASWWNMGIAATALKDWPEARRAWIECGVKIANDEGEVDAGCGRACVRLDPQGTAEVVWGRRIDPARILVQNVPLSQSGRRYGDIILNDGAQEGVRVSRGQEYPVFNELAIWKVSEYSTFAVLVHLDSGTASESVERLCGERGMSFEDWGTVRVLCAACSRGNPGEHECSTKESLDGPVKFGFAAKTRASLDSLLAEWAEIEPSVKITAIELVVQGVNG